MFSAKRALGSGMAVLGILAGSAATAPTASAAVGDWHCDTRDNGQLCIQAKTNGYKVWYTNQSGSVKNLDFNLGCNTGTYGDEGSFQSNPGWTNSYLFEVGRKQWCLPAMYDFGTKKWYYGSVAVS
jgi:hypothetical protein